MIYMPCVDIRHYVHYSSHSDVSENFQGCEQDILMECPSWPHTEPINEVDGRDGYMRRNIYVAMEREPRG